MIKCIEVPHIASVEVRPDFEKVQKLFPSIPLGSLNRLEVPIGMLLGQNANALLPVRGLGEHRVEGLRIWQTILGEFGYVLDGFHPHIWTQTATNCGNSRMRAPEEELINDPSDFMMIHIPLVHMLQLQLQSVLICLVNVTLTVKSALHISQFARRTALAIYHTAVGLKRM